jgi:hypothetical protein
MRLKGPTIKKKSAFFGSAKTIVGLRPSFSAQVRFGEPSRNISPKEWKKAVASGITLLSKEVLPGERSNSLEYRVYAN